MSTVHVALLRGINVGGHRKVPMAQLRDALGGAGFDGVRTHLQSGNVLVERDGRPDAVARDLEAAIAAEFGFDVDVVVRTREELAAVVEADPLLDEVTAPKLHHVVFLSGPPDTAARRRLEETDWGDERLAFAEREVYAWYPGGYQRSPLGAALARADLGVIATGRNWNTVTKLLELAGG
jgi:uncharacterized protein (DUF1697 family)